MIGGSDITIRTTGGPTALDFCVRMIRREWPNSVFEDATNETYFKNYADVSFSSLNELFVYQDAEAADAWQTLGAVESNLNTMIHLLLSATEITVVVDDAADVAMARILDAIRAGLKHDLLTMRAAA